MVSRPLALILAGLLAAAAFASACASKAESPEPTTASASVTAVPTATAQHYPEPVPATGIRILDTIIAAAISGDIATLRSSIRFTPMACIAIPQGIGAPPLCRTGETNGMPVDVLPSAACEGFFTRPDELRLADALPGNARFYAAYRTTADTFPPGKYIAVFVRPDASQRKAAFAVVTDDSNIRGINYGCDETPEGFVMSHHLTDAILPPP